MKTIEFEFEVGQAVRFKLDGRLGVIYELSVTAKGISYGVEYEQKGATRAIHYCDCGDIGVI